MRTQDDHWRGRSARRAGHDHRAVSVRAPSLLDRGQLLVAPRRKSCGSPPRALAHDDADTHARACELAEPSRDLFSIVQRKVVTPNDFTSLRELEDRLRAFQGRYEQTATPFQWAFTRVDLADLLPKLKAKEMSRAA